MLVMRLAGEMAWMACVLMVAVTVLVVNTVLAENGAGSIAPIATRAGTGTDRPSAPPRLAPPVLLSVEIVSDDDRAAERNAAGDPARCSPGTADCHAVPDAAALQRAH